MRQLGKNISERRWTVDEFYRAYDAGVLDNNKRWELHPGKDRSKR